MPFQTDRQPFQSDIAKPFQPDGQPFQSDIPETPQIAPESTQGVAAIEPPPTIDFAPQIADPSDIDPATPADPSPQLRAAPERTLPQKIGDFFIGKPEQRPFLPSDAGRAEKFDHALKAVASMPVRAFVKFGKGLLLGTPDLAFAAIKKITPDELWVDGVENMSLDQAIDWAMGYDPSGFSKLVSEVAEFSGGIKAVGGLVGKGVPKSATVVDKALRNASVFALARTGRELSKFGAELIDPKTDYQYVGAAGVIADFGIGLGLSLVNSASRPVLATIAKSPVGRAISDAGHRVVIAFTKQFPVLADKIRANPNKFFRDQILQSAKKSGINIDDLNPQQNAVLNHVAREAERRYVKAVGNFATPDVVARRPRQLVAPEKPLQAAKPITLTKPTPTAIKPVAKPIEAPTQQIEVSDTEAAKILGKSLETIKADATLKKILSKELIITEFQPSDFVPKSKKGPGLTRAEQQIVTPEVQGELRFAQTQGLPVGFKAGQKASNDIAKRRLDDFRTARKVEKGALQDARKLVTEYAKDPVIAKKLIISLANVDSPAKMAAFADKIGEFVKEAERKQAITSYKTTFNQLKKDNRLGKVAFGKLRPAARKRILKFADTIDLKKLSVAKKEELQGLMGKIKDLGVDLSEGIAQLDVDTQDALKQLDPHIVALDRLNKTAVADMGLEEIQIAEDSLRYIVRQNEIQNKEVFGNRTRDLAETETKAVEEVSVSKKQKKVFAKEAKKGVVAPFKRTGFLAKGKEGLITQSETIPTLIQTSTVKGATATEDVLDTKTHDGLRETSRIQFESVDFLKEQYAKHNITTKTLDSFDKEFEVVIGGKKRSVTADDLASIEMHLRSLDNLEQLRKTKALIIQGKRAENITIQELVVAVGKLTPSQIKVLDIANAQNRKITAPAVNETSENLWGYSIARDANYWPLARKLPQKVGGAVIDFSAAVEQQSPFQPRTGGTADITIIPFRQQMWQTIQTGARFGGTAVPFHNARGLLNSKKWQNAMIESGRKAEMDAIIKIFRRTQGVSSDKNALELSFQAVLSNVAKSKLSLRPSTPLVQAASFPVAFSEIDAKYAFPLKGFKVQSGKSQLARLKKFSPTMRLRFDGGRMSPEVGNISAPEGLNMLVFNKVSITTKPLIPLRKVDQTTILEIDKMVQRKIRDTTNLKGDAFWEAVSLETERVTRFTQPMWDHFDRSVNLTSPNILLRSGLAFRAPREAMLNTAIRGRDALTKGEKAKFARSWGSVFSSIVMARLIKLATKFVTVGLLSFLIRGRFPKREKEFSDFAADIAKDAVNIVPFGEIINPAVDVAIKGKTLREAEFNNLLGDFVTTAAKIAVDGTKAIVQAVDGDTKKAKESLGKAVGGTIQTAAEIKGLPFTDPRDVIKPALKEEPAGTFGRTRTTRTRTTRTRKTRTFGERTR